MHRSSVASCCSSACRSRCWRHSARWKKGHFACFYGKFLKLQEPCFALGVTYDPAAVHAPGYDTYTMTYGAVRMRTAVYKWTVERALRTPVDVTIRKLSATHPQTQKA